jgi:hypothetical protein
MSRSVERRIRRLERSASTQPDEPVECEMSDEEKNALHGAFAAMGMAPDKIEARVSQRYHALRDQVANLSPVEREQRLLAIRAMVTGNPTVGARLDEALDEVRRVVFPSC